MLFRLRENFAECKGRNKNINENMIQKRKPSKDKKRQKKVGFKVRNDLNLPTFTRDK